MAEPVGITGTALAVATLLYSSCRTINDVIGQYKAAPKEYKDISQDLKGIQNTLDVLRTTLQGIDDSGLSEEQAATLEHLEAPLKTCNDACADFAAKLSRLTSHSKEDHTAAWDRLRLHFNKSDVALLREKLNTTKSTLQVALGVSTLKTLGHNQAQLDEFQETTATALSEFSGKVQALTFAVDALSITGVTISPRDVEAVKKALASHDQLLKQCLQFCTRAQTAADAAQPGVQVRYAKATEKARQVLGNLGPVKADAPTVSVGTAHAADTAFQGVGNIDIGGLSQDALNFLGGR